MKQLSIPPILYEYEVGSARHEIDDFFWKDLCDNYIEIVKERLYQPDIHGIEERRSGQFALYYTFFNILKLYAIYVPHITECIYQEFFMQYEKSGSIHLHAWQKPLTLDEDILRFGENLKDVIYDMRKYKSERNLSMRTEMDRLEIKTEPKFFDWFRQTENDIKACANTNIVEIVLL